MNLEALKEKARRHEQKEEWKKALDAYRQVVQRQDEDEPPDITLFNRIGDIQTRLGQLDPAVESYEKAVDLYLEAELPNNAIAICKKVIRNLPDRSIFFLRMGQIRGSQGFMTDAKQNFLTYAEQMTVRGDLDSALDALVDLVDLVPEDVEIRLGLASQLESHSRIEEGVAQYTEAYRHLLLQERSEEAEALGEKIVELDPEAVLPDIDTIHSTVVEEPTEEPTTDGLGLSGFELGSGVQDGALSPGEVEFLEEGDGVEGEETGVVELGGDEFDDDDDEEIPFGLGEALDDSGDGDIEVGEVFEGDVQEESEEEGEALPTLSFDPDDAADSESLPTFGLDDGDDEEVEFGLDDSGEGFGADEDEEEVEPLPTLEVEEDAEEEEGDALPTFDVDEDEVAEAVSSFSEMDQEEAAEALSLLEASDDEEDLPFIEEVGDDLEEGSRDEAETDLQGLPGLDEAESTPEAESSPEEDVAEALEDRSFERGFEDVDEEVPYSPEPSSAHAEAADRGDLDAAIELLREEIEENPEAVDLYQRQVEYAFRKGDDDALVPAYLDLANHLLRDGSTQKARAVFQQVLSLAPGHEDAVAGLQEIDGADTDAPPAEVTSSEEYVDLGSMILGDEAEKTTRWQVTAESPTGDDQADFAKMLNQFKEKVSENVDADDVSAHHDLGTAYLEMGLLDEAISEFQAALRASPDHLPTHEVMGRCWMEKGEPDMAVRALNRALDANFEVEDELIGIYYTMGLAKEELGSIDEAVEFYEKVFSLDINFEDVTERLRALR